MDAIWSCCHEPFHVRKAKNTQVLTGSHKSALSWWKNGQHVAKIILNCEFTGEDPKTMCSHVPGLQTEGIARGKHLASRDSLPFLRRTPKTLNKSSISPFTDDILCTALILLILSLRILQSVKKTEPVSSWSILKLHPSTHLQLGNLKVLGMQVMASQKMRRNLCWRPTRIVPRWKLHCWKSGT